MAFVRCYTGTDSQSHFEDLDLLPPDVERSIAQAAALEAIRGQQDEVAVMVREFHKRRDLIVDTGHARISAISSNLNP